MVILRPKEIRNLNPEERKKQLQQLRTELSRERAAVASGTKPENSGKIREIRRTIARILTIEKEPKKKAGQAKTEEKLPAKKGEKKPEGG